MEKRSNADAVTGPHQYLCKRTCRLLEYPTIRSLAASLESRLGWTSPLPSANFAVLHTTGSISLLLLLLLEREYQVRKTMPSPLPSNSTHSRSEYNANHPRPENITTRSIIPPLLSESNIPRQSISPKARNRRKRKTGKISPILPLGQQTTSRPEWMNLS